MNDGLPTLEMHRQLPVTVQAKHLFATNLIDDVVIGNVYASNEELEALGQLNRYQTELTIVFEEATSEIEKEIVIKNQHFRRGDITQQMIRSTEVRKKYKNELQVVLEPHQDSRKNRVGRIIEEELVLLEFIKPWTKFRFIEK